MLQDLYLTLGGDQKPPDLDELGKPVNVSSTDNGGNKPPDLDENHRPVSDNQLQPNNDWLSKAWHAMSDPITNKPSEWAKEVSDSLTNHTADESMLGSQVRGAIGGGLEGIGGLVSGLSSPINLATAALTGGESIAAKSGMSSLANIANIGSKIASAPVIAHGGEEIFNPESTMTQRAMGVAEMAGGASAMMHSPSINPGEVNPSIHQPISDDMVNNYVQNRNIEPPQFNQSPDELANSLGVNHQDLNVVPHDDMIPQNNGSGESAASMEAISRQKSMAMNGDHYVVYDSTGNKKPIIGPDAVDYQVKPGESFGIENVNGKFTLLDNAGGKHPSNTVPINTPKESKATITPEMEKPGKPSAVIIKNPDPSVIKKVMQEGYVFDSIRDDGAFRMIQSGKKPTNLPVLESDVNNPNARPTQSKANSWAGSDAGFFDTKALPTKQTAKDVATEALNFPRAVLASMDFSAPLRQGLGLIHKKQFWTSLDDMFKAWGSKEAYDAIQHGISERPLFKERVSPSGVPLKSFAEEAGLKLTDMKSLTSKEEAFMSTWANKIPGVARSERAYVAFLNKLRADTFESLITDSKVFGVDGTVNLPIAREFGEFVNAASGRGNLGALEKSATTLNTVLFSPRLIASRVKMLNPATYIMASPQVRKEYMKSLLAIAAAGNTVTQLGKMAGGTIEYDPRSSDFGKVKIGNVRIDPYGGFQQYIVAASRLLSGSSISSTSDKEYNLLNPKGPYDPTYLGTMGRFAQGKLNPVLGFAVALLNGEKEMSGQKMDFTTPNPMNNAIAQRFIPIVMQDIYSIAQEDPKLAAILGPAIIGGMNSQVYGGR